MLGYEWGSTHSPDPPQHDHHHDHLILTDHHHHQDHVVVNHHHHHHDPSSASSSSHHHRPIFDDPFSLYNFPPNQQQQQQQQQQFPLYDNDQRAFPGASTYNHPHHHHPNSMSMLNFQDTTTLPGPTGSGYPVLVPKPEPEYANRIGLNLGGRTYFAAADDDLVSRLYRRSRAVEPVNIPKCQAEGCNADLSHAKHYHRRHKVCEFHSKAATVIAAGLTQRFCQQCSRFHLLSEFDNGKRSCRKRLADHNRRRRKSHQQTAVNRDQRAYSQSENVHDSPSENIQRSPSDSGANSSSSVTVAISSPRVSSFDSSFRQRSYE